MLCCILTDSNSPSEPWFHPSQWVDPSNSMKTFTHVCFSTLLVLNYVPRSLHVAHLILAYWAKLRIPSPLWILSILACSLFCHLTSVISISLQQAMQTMQLFIHLFTASVFLWSCTSAFLPAPCRSLAELFHQLFHPNTLSSVKAAQNRGMHIPSVFKLFLLSVPRFYSLPWRNTSHPESSKKPFPMQREESGLQPLCWGFPKEQKCRRCAELAPAVPPSFPGGFSWRKQPGKRLWKGQAV